VIASKTDVGTSSVLRGIADMGPTIVGATLSDTTGIAVVSAEVPTGVVIALCSEVTAGKATEDVSGPASSEEYDVEVAVD
jgi:hypothetical protein